MARAQLQRTLLAAQGLSLVARFDAFFASELISGYVPRLVEPPGESTAGGKQAVQHIALVAQDPASPAITVGWLNCATNQAKLRTRGCVQSILTRRSKGRRVLLDAQAYQRFFERAQKFLQDQGMVVTAEVEPPDAPGEPNRALGGIPTWLWVVLAFLLVAVVALLVVLYLRGAG